jgi:hypothetical protein
MFKLYSEKEPTERELFLKLESVDGLGIIKVHLCDEFGNDITGGHLFSVDTTTGRIIRMSNINTSLGLDLCLDGKLKLV